MNGVDRFFVDTNVVIYSVDPADKRKQRAARFWMDALWAETRGSISWQVLHEFYVNAVRKLGTPAESARSLVQALATWRPVDTTLGLAERAWHWTDEASVSYWDALIISAAERAGCSRLLSEDFQEGRRFGSVTVVNPFRAMPAAFGLGTTTLPQ